MTGYRVALVMIPYPVAQVEIDWHYLTPDQIQGARGERELVSDGWMYQASQWFPRMSVYDDVNGWQTDQFLGSGEFYLEFGDYDVEITVPYNHIVQSTGSLQNPEVVLTDEQRDRIEQALKSEEPMFIIRPDEVMTAGSRPTNTGTLTWHFKAENVLLFTL